MIAPWQNAQTVALLFHKKAYCIWGQWIPWWKPMQHHCFLLRVWDFWRICTRYWWTLWSNIFLLKCLREHWYLSVGSGFSHNVPIRDTLWFFPTCFESDCLCAHLISYHSSIAATSKTYQSRSPSDYWTSFGDMDWLIDHPIEVDSLWVPQPFRTHFVQLVGSNITRYFPRTAESPNLRDRRRDSPNLGSSSKHYLYDCRGAPAWTSRPPLHGIVFQNIPLTMTLISLACRVREKPQQRG